MSSDPPFTHWTGSMPQLNLNEPASTSRQNSTDQLDDAESLLLEGFGGDSSEDIENILGDEMISHFEECLREGEMGAPVLETNTGSNSLNVPTTSAFNSVPTLQNPPVSLRLNRLCAKTSFSEPNSKIASYLARIPFRHASFFRNDQKLLTLDFSYNPELNVGLHLRKFDYFQLCRFKFYKTQTYSLVLFSQQPSKIDYKDQISGILVEVSTNTRLKKFFVHGHRLGLSWKKSMTTFFYGT